MGPGACQGAHARRGADTGRSGGRSHEGGGCASMITFKVWNYGLFGDENTWVIHPRRFNKWGAVLVDIDSFEELTLFIQHHGVIGAKIEPGEGYAAWLQLPTTYSTCGAMGYRNLITKEVWKALRDIF